MLVTSVPLLGRFMAANAALAIVMLVESVWSSTRSPTRSSGMAGSTPTSPGVPSGIGRPRPGRLHRLRAQPRRVPQHPRAIRPGHAGPRDHGVRRRRRPRHDQARDMGAIAARRADVVVVTDFHPGARTRRRSDACSSRPPVKPCRTARCTRSPIRRPRSARRSSLAGQGDVILYAGPGHEDYHEVAGEKIPYSARDDSRDALHEARMALNARPDPHGHRCRDRRPTRSPVRRTTVSSCPASPTPTPA